MESATKGAKVLVQPLGLNKASTKTLIASSTARVGKCPTPWQAFHLAQRVLGLAAAIFFVYSTVESGVYSLRTLFGVIKHDDNFGGYQADLILRYVGSKTVKESLLFTHVLGGDSTPRPGTVYLQLADKVASTKCEGVTDGVVDWLYSNSYLRSNWHDLVTQTAYNLTYLRDSELIAPIVDCSFSAITMGDITSARVFYLMRKKAYPTDVFLIVASFSTQDFEVPEQYQDGPAVSVLLTVINDMQAMNVHHSLVLAMGYPLEGPWYSVYTYGGVTEDGFVILDHIPPEPDVVYKRRVVTATRSGLYIKSEKSQSNIKNMYWTTYNDPVLALTSWRWAGSTVISNAWGWARCVHFVFAVGTILNLIVLMMVVYRNYQRGKIWIGDAFVSISDSLYLRGTSILVVWAMENFWQLSIMTVRYGSTQGNIVKFFSFPQIMHGDLMVLYVTLAGLLGTILHERIDPGLTVFLYEIGYNSRFTLGNWFPAVKEAVVRNALKDYLSGIADIPPELNDFCPFGFWTTHQLRRDATAILAALSPIFMTYVVLVIYAVIRKAYRRVSPSRALAYSSRITKGSSNLSEGRGIKSPFTLFELATGAELQNRVGLVSDYDNCVYIKGMRYATADGIYCNGFVIANGQWLIRTTDLWSILLIILTGTRLRDVYVYEVKDHKASQTARLVYPNTLTLRHLTKLNTTLLA
ncbi:hypothetical protein Poli38472_004226 [Pythium oligandrum]|uniref:Uncharacterized protein n=1 Tax=Pythium oligandrum TaxID=41045 RepID=A0A8K1CPQ3_PYTOL|nr:hypothetical protein Poli38472_004226 [Pythium oligandrum]|eukprot:TMW66461.1 hypothetical protein Poli38472_004226 [Pythium oligandrum]